MKKAAGVLILLFAATVATADISQTDKTIVMRLMMKQASTGHTMKVLDATSRHQAAVIENQAKRDAKHALQQQRKGHSVGKVSAMSLHPRPTATGSVQLIDAAGVEYFINTNITFSTSSSASAGMSEASYTQAVNASTSAGGVVASTLNDAYDGYQTICVSLTNATGPCETGNAAYTIYNKNGPASVDATVPATSFCTGRQYVFPVQTIGPLSVSRKVYIPNNDQYARWINIFTNTSGSPVTFTMITGNNLGSDSNTIITNSSSGDTTVTTGDLWATTFQNYSGNSSSDPRLGHVFQGTGAPTPVSSINFANGDDNPFWAYSITLNPGQTKIIVNFAAVQPTKALAASKSANLALFGANAQQCMSATELAEVVNFVSNADLAIVKTQNTPSPVFGGQAVSYNIAVTNNGPATASSVSVTDVLPAGSGFVSASGSGWTCNNVAGTVTCTLPTLAVGPASPITLTITAPAASVPGTLSNTATVSSANTDPTPGNNSSTANSSILPAGAVPAMSNLMLALLAMALGFIALKAAK